MHILAPTQSPVHHDNCGDNTSMLLCDVLNPERNRLASEIHKLGRIVRKRNPHLTNRLMRVSAAEEQPWSVALLLVYQGATIRQFEKVMSERFGPFGQNWA